ncbi:FecR family protein [Spirosoma validum]|uniref:FecR domain-containing protein n=1 Tax=Spirosoma validum TaxID=2771355 RepID=A0A927AYY2_9BACT|nr:FecR domain-containing protein [Spirosoma validum]MBD2752353.1 FecR domain-containing protein [Spirosoma validum]
MDSQRLQNYLRNQCTPEEARVVLTYLATDEGQRQLQHVLNNDLDNFSQQPLDALEQQSAQRLFGKIQASKTTKPKLSYPQENWLGQRWHWLAAATVSLLLLATGGWWFYQRNATPQLLTLHTDYGQIRRVSLPDHSVVTMNGNTSIRYADHWSTDSPREVWVEGEAFFEVVHTKNHQQFRVHLPERMNVEVLGTRFNVYTRQSATKVVLNEGRIQMRVADNPDNQLEMKPGEMFFADTKARVFYKKTVDAQAQSSWRTDKLVFNGTTLAEIATLLHDTYGLDVEIRDQKLIKQKFSGTIPSKNAATILKGLSGLFDLTITEKNNHVLIE